ncbi:MAG: hypothetical protein ABIO16_02180 [Nocardioides sp.]
MGRVRGRRLPARVYWTRRLAVLGTATLLVFATGRVLTGSSDGSDSGSNPGAVQAAAKLTPSVTPESTGPSVIVPKGTKGAKKATPDHPTPLAQPSGPCTPQDVAVTPEVRSNVGGSDVVIALGFHTLVATACTFDVSPTSVTLNITSGHDAIWSTRQCPAAIPTSSLVVRRDLATYVYVTWNAKRSDETCSRLTDWAYPGWYHVKVAALGGEPADEQFQLAVPQPGTVTSTVTPDPPNHTKHTKKPKNGG